MKKSRFCFCALGLYLFILFFMGACDGNSSTVSVSFTGTHVTFSENSPQGVALGHTFMLNVTPEDGYELLNTVEGDCPAGSWQGNTYTTGAILEDCDMEFFASESANTRIVTPSGEHLTITPSGAQTVAYQTTASFEVSAELGYTLSDTVTGTCPAGSWNASTYVTGEITEDCTVIFEVIGSTSLSASVSDLALSINCQPSSGCSSTQNLALTGNPRAITLTNLGSEDAVNLSVDASVLPSGTTVSSNTCSGTLPPSASCSITITPGSEATSDCVTGIAPTPDVLSISADNANVVTVDVSVLSYGCIYQGGYLFAVDDSTDSAGSIGGKVVTLTDQAAQLSTIWSSDGSGSSSISYDAIYGISEISTASVADPSGGQELGQSSCNGASDGDCNSNNIYLYYENYSSGAPVNITYYATGLCTAEINSYSDWYLPAICEMGYDNTLGPEGSTCGNINSPALQNIQSNLVNAGNIGGMAPGSGDNYYWSSTEFSGNSLQYAWFQLYNLNQEGKQLHFLTKIGQFGVRCVRVVEY